MGKNKHKHKGPTLSRSALPVSAVQQRSWLEVTALPIVLVVSLIIFTLHAYGADYSRRYGILTFDESVYTRLGLQVKSKQPYNTQTLYQEQLAAGRQLPDYLNTKVFVHPPVFPTLIAGAYWFMEKADNYTMEDLYAFSSKVSNLMGCLIVVLVYFLGRSFFNYRVGLIAALLAAVEFNLWCSSQKVWMESTVTFFFWLTLYLLIKATENKRFFYPAAVSAAVALQVKYTTGLLYFVYIAYLFLFSRETFKKKDLYLSFLLTALLFLPWLLYNIKHYGSDTVHMMLFHGGGYTERVTGFLIKGGLSIIILASISFLILNNQRLINYAKTHMKIIQRVLAGGIMLLVMVFFAQADVRASILNSLSFTGFPRNGWKMGLFTEEPIHFYLKQILEYSPFYFLFYAALVRVPYEGRKYFLLVIASVAVLSFGMLWGSFQGRYILSLVPAAMLLAACLIDRIFAFLIKNKSLGGHIATTAFTMVLLYFLVKTLRVDFIHALNGNSAYY